ncbi:hypothetical protein E1B28_006347 [Marasmius oreades]|uniref:Uncharacterized protein n=1 Tax=Marasmius oreades TaxID=181124 RepID=A0A9P7S826_9AGAR|nr:uncharacterized protein E1B28_006347 [Marasmius oreades]KAG7095623.1 hypothetical protein E1B28_006347 [Marasmius oreades]
MQSNVGNAQVYEAGDQRTSKGTVTDQTERFEYPPTNAHNATDSKDERSLANRLAAAETQEIDNLSNKTKNTITDPLEPARSHGNEPSRGAKIDAELQKEDEEELERKGKA